MVQEAPDAAHQALLALFYFHDTLQSSAWSSASDVGVLRM